MTAIERMIPNNSDTWWDSDRGQTFTTIEREVTNSSDTWWDGD